MRLSDTLLKQGVRVFDIAFWRSTADEPLRRLGREVHYPPIIDVLDPYILLVHQGMVEGLFLEDMKKRGKEVRRNMAFESYSVPDNKTGPLQVNCRANVNQDKRSVLTQYLIGCKCPCVAPSVRSETNICQATVPTPRSARVSLMSRLSACRRPPFGVFSTVNLLLISLTSGPRRSFTHKSMVQF